MGPNDGDDEPAQPASAASVWSDSRHPGTVEEWVFATWTSDVALGVISGHRIVGPTAWYWAALARVGRPLLHITDFEVPVRADPFILKGESMWAEHLRDAPMEQWTVGNETYASSLDDPDDALGRAYGIPTPIAFDLEWYATAGPTAIADGYEQIGVVHGAIEILGEPTVELSEEPAHRWHRWIPRDADAGLAPVRLPVAVAHSGLRAPFAFPDGTVLDPVLTSTGWRRRATRRSIV
ncbi:hypothetical protein [Ilumatobacter sp.]|uniref:hypothetical protein n=1 Tax=Ilumatobacter sp. TaxID=1967498 RepID=UPI003C34D42C